jgi:hypothetical protein
MLFAAIPDFFSAPLNVSAILPMNSFWLPRARFSSRSRTL